MVALIVKLLLAYLECENRRIDNAVRRYKRRVTRQIATTGELPDEQSERRVFFRVYRKIRRNAELSSYLRRWIR